MTLQEEGFFQPVHILCVAGRAGRKVGDVEGGGREGAGEGQGGKGREREGRGEGAGGGGWKGRSHDPASGRRCQRQRLNE